MGIPTPLADVMGHQLYSLETKHKKNCSRGREGAIERKHKVQVGLCKSQPPPRNFALLISAPKAVCCDRRVCACT